MHWKWGVAFQETQNPAGLRCLTWHSSSILLLTCLASSVLTPRKEFQEVLPCVPGWTIPAEGKKAELQQQRTVLSWSDTAVTKGGSGTGPGEGHGRAQNPGSALWH